MCNVAANKNTWKAHFQSDAHTQVSRHDVYKGASIMIDVLGNPGISTVWV